MAELTTKAKKIKLVATDIDGVWTDARMYVTPEGEWMKAFSTYDGMATAMLKKRGIIVAILTGENSDCYCTG
jgi:3-deoxy-D-manno-octulosonate 8-phosphate phosphatase KdsC-like HAD superfamily phosphatase